jgi:Bacterial nucleoid DNA-binding protein
MTKAELIDALAQDTALTRKECEAVLNSLTKNIEKALQDGQEIKLVDFGSFKVSQRAARTGRNPKTGDTIQIKAARVPSFKPGKKLKEAVN